MGNVSPIPLCLLLDIFLAPLEHFSSQIKLICQDLLPMTNGIFIGIATNEWVDFFFVVLELELSLHLEPLHQPFLVKGFSR
jgi:hypothetical protein